MQPSFAAYRELLLKLAADFVIGFCDSVDLGNFRAGRPRRSKKPDSFDLNYSPDLAYAIKLIQSKNKCTPLTACETLKKHNMDKLRGVTVKALLERFYRAEKKLNEPFEGPLYSKLYTIIAPYKPDFRRKKTARMRG